MEEIGKIGVDAGLAGFFNNKPDYTDDEWSEFCDSIRGGMLGLKMRGSLVVQDGEMDATPYMRTKSMAKSQHLK